MRGEEQESSGWKQYKPRKEHSGAIQVDALPDPSKAALAESMSTLNTVAMLSGPHLDNNGLTVVTRGSLGGTLGLKKWDF